VGSSASACRISRIATFSTASPTWIFGQTWSRSSCLGPMHFNEIVGNSPALLEALRRVERVAPTDVRPALARSCSRGPYTAAADEATGLS
jgi:hypothetical protein